MRIPIIFGYLKFHKSVQWSDSNDYKPFLVIHWFRSDWIKCKTYSKRIFML